MSDDAAAGHGAGTREPGMIRTGVPGPCPTNRPPGIGAAAPWSPPHSEVVVPGDHSTVPEEHFRTTVLVVPAWLSEHLRLDAS